METLENRLCNPDVVNKHETSCVPSDWRQPFISNDAAENKSNVMKDYAQANLEEPPES